ncbi:MAG: YfbM family protein [Opitutaceae bacterium]|jgi:hypothetical protein|nr:YfbM family protein [Opitutaceae bacterium]
MSCLGVHFSLSEKEILKLKSFKADSDRLEYLQEEIEEVYFDEHEDRVAESDKSWDAMHRALADGDLSYTKGPYPLRLVVMGGEPLYAASDYIMSLKAPAEVRDAAKALSTITKDDFRKRYDAINEAKYDYPKSDEDFECTWGWLAGVVIFYKKAAEEGRWVLFSVDQ